MSELKIGAVDVGGGTRGIFGAGVLDRCMDLNIKFSYFIGVSAGSANGASYLAGQRGRNLKFYDDYAFRKEYMSRENFMKTGSYIGLDYIYGELSNEDGEYPLDYDAMMANPCGFEIVATNAVTGRPVYFRKEEMKRNCYDFFKASSCVPTLNRPYMVGKIPCYDGGLSDPVPFRRAFRAGCDKVVVILTKPVDMLRTPGKDRVMSRTIKMKYPNTAKTWVRRSEIYNNAVAEALELEKEGKVLIVAPSDIGQLRTLTQDHEALEDLYRQGYEEGKKIKAFME